MRKLVMTTGERFDIDAVRADIDAIVSAFDRYLDEYPVKTAKSMHSLLGPVPMILDGARVRKESVQTLVGRAVRAHEMNPRTRGYLRATALDALETATSQLLDLCGNVPITAVTKVTERIRYSVYYARRKKGIQQLDETRRAFVSFLRERYTTDGALAQAWGEEGLTFETVRYPSKRGIEQAGGKKKGRKTEDLEAFWALPIADRLAAEEDEEDE